MRCLAKVNFIATIAVEISNLTEFKELIANDARINLVCSENVLESVRSLKRRRALQHNDC